MESTETEKTAIQVTLKTLDQLKLNYNKSQEDIEFMTASYFEKNQLYDGTVRNTYWVGFFMEFDPEFGESQFFTAVLDAAAMKVIFIIVDHGYLEVVYDKNGKAIKTKFISPSFPYDKQ